MMDLLVLKERMIKLYQKADYYIKPIIKFLVSLTVFMMINQQIGYDSRLKSLPVVLALSLLGAFTPSSILVLLAAAVSAGHVYFISKILSIIVIAVFFILYFLFARFTPRYGYVVLAVPVLYILKIPYVIPLLLGMTASPAAIVPAGCGVIVFYFFRIIREAAATMVNNSAEDVLALYKYVMDSLIGNKEMILAVIIFAAVLLVTYFVRKSKIDYAFYIAVAAGVTTNIIAFLIGDLRLNISNQIIAMILGSLASGVIVLVVQFFRLTLDYTAVERTQFEDDDYYYYVKAVPKMKVTVPKKDVKRINVQKSTGNTTNLKQAQDTVSKKMDDRDEFVENYKQDFELNYEDDFEDDPIDLDGLDRINKR